MTLTTPTRPAASREPGTSTGPVPVRGPRLSWQRRRQLPWTAAGVVLVIGCALLFAVLSQQGSATRQVLVAARAMPAGHVLTATDLQPEPVRGSALTSVPAASESAVVGQPLTVALLPGALLIPADVGTAAPVGAGLAVVALALKPGQYPPSIGAGDHVEVVNTAANTAAPATRTAQGAGGGTFAATVIAVDATADGDTASAVVSVQLPQADAPQLAALSAAGQASLVLLPATPETTTQVTP